MRWLFDVRIVRYDYYYQSNTFKRAILAYIYNLNLRNDDFPEI